MNDPDFLPASLASFLQVVFENLWHVARQKGMQVERVFNRDPSHNSQLLQTSSITTDKGIAAFAILEMMQYFSARERVFSTCVFWPSRRGAGTRA